MGHVAVRKLVESPLLNPRPSSPMPPKPQDSVKVECALKNRNPNVVFDSHGACRRLARSSSTSVIAETSNIPHYLCRMDNIDQAILSILVDRASISKAEIARRIGLTPSAVSYRIRRLEESGAIQGYETRLLPSTLGLDVLAFVFVREAKPTGSLDTGELLGRVRGVEEVHKIAGEDCFLVKLRAESTAGLGTILDTEIGPIPTVAQVRTTIVLRTVLEGPPCAGFFPISNGEESDTAATAEDD